MNPNTSQHRGNFYTDTLWCYMLLLPAHARVTAPCGDCDRGRFYSARVPPRLDHDRALLPKSCQGGEAVELEEGDEQGHLQDQLYHKHDSLMPMEFGFQPLQFFCLAYFFALDVALLETNNKYREGVKSSIDCSIYSRVAELGSLSSGQ